MAATVNYYPAAASGTVTTDSPLSGDGSAGSPIDLPSTADVTVTKMTAAANNTDVTVGQLVAKSTNAAGQAVLLLDVNGTTRGKFRTDSAGNVSFVAVGGTLDFFVGGDFGTGQIVYRSFANGNVQIKKAGVSGIPTDTGMGFSVVGSRAGFAKGADVASASTLTLGDDGNYFQITGTTTINYITFTNWTAGSMMTLYFAGALTLTHNAGSVPANTYALDLQGGVNASMAAGSTITLVRDTALTKWLEVGRRTA